jgi:hypothetical protein
MMQAVMEFSLAELWSPYGRLLVAFAGNHNTGNARRQHLWFPAPLRSSAFAFNVENGIDSNPGGVLNIAVLTS